MRYNALSKYLTSRFGGKVYKLALDGGMTCPNRDGRIGTDGCVFCSEGGSGDFAEPYDGDVWGMIGRAKERVRAKTRDDKFIVYFQSYTNTYAPTEYLRTLFTAAISHPSAVALSVGTRPDCLPPDILDLLGALNAQKPVFVELGLQTVNARTARLIRRGYETEVYDKAAENLRSRGINVVAHVILGLPGETKEDMLETVRHVGRTADGIKLQLLHVLRGTELEKMYGRGEVIPLSLEEYTELLADCVEALPPDIVIHRLTGDAPKRLLVAPSWSADKKRVLGAISATFERRDVGQGGNRIRI